MLERHINFLQVTHKLLINSRLYISAQKCRILDIYLYLHIFNFIINNNYIQLLPLVIVVITITVIIHHGALKRMKDTSNTMFTTVEYCFMWNTTHMSSTAISIVLLSILQSYRFLWHKRNKYTLPLLELTWRKTTEWVFSLLSWSSF